MATVTEPKELKAGRELDELIAEKVMGVSLTLPRERAMAIVGASYVRETGRNFHLQVRNFDITVSMPPGEDLPSHPSDDNWNQRYFRHAAAKLLTFPNEVADIVERDIQACRLAPRPYSTDIAAAWEVVAKLSPEWYSEVRNYFADGGKMFWVAEFDSTTFRPHTDATHSAEAETAPLAICLAALKAVQL